MTILFPYMARWNSANRSRYYHLLNKVSDLGHNVIIVEPPPLKSEETNYIDVPAESHSTIRIYTVEMSFLLWNITFPFDKLFKKGIYTIASYFLVRRLLREHSVDCMLLYNVPQYVYTLGNSVPVIFDYADDYLAMLREELNISHQNIVSRVSENILDRLISKAVLVTVVSEKLKEKVSNQKSMLLENGADSKPPNGKQTVLHIDKRQPVVGYVGAFEYFINLDLILNAAKNLPDHTFLLVGAGREFKRVKEDIVRRRIKNVLLTGAVPHQQAMQFIREMDVCLNLFKHGAVSDAACPIKLFEYLLIGKPVITSRHIEVERLDRELKCLIFVETEKDLVDAIRRVTKDTKTFQALVKGAAKVIRARYTWKSLALKLTNRVEQVLSNASHYR